MIKFSFSIFLLSCALFPLSMATAYGRDMAGSVFEVDLENAIELSLSNMETIRISGVEAEAMYHRYREAAASRYPDLTGHGEWTNNARYPVNERYPPGKMSDYEAGMGATLRQLIWSSGRVSRAVESARKGFEMAMLTREAVKEDVVYSAKMSYYAVISAQQALKAVSESYRNSLDNKEIIAGKSSMGRVSRRDNIKVESDIATRVPLVTNMESDVITAKNTLKRLMGIDMDSDIEVSGGFSEVYDKKDYADLIGLLMEREPTLKVFEKNISLKDSVIQAEKAEYLPNIYGFASWDYRGKSDRAKKWYIGKERIMDQFGVLGIRVDVPIFDSGRTRERIMQARKDREKAVLEFERTSRDLSLRLKNAVSEYNKYVETLEANRRSVQLAEENFRFLQDLFATGQVTLLEINDAELVLTGQKLEKVNTLYNIAVTGAQIDRLIAEGAAG